MNQTVKDLQRIRREARLRAGLPPEEDLPATVGSTLGPVDKTFRKRLQETAAAAVPLVYEEPVLPPAPGRSGICPDCHGRQQILTPGTEGRVIVEDCHCLIQERMEKAAREAGLSDDARNWTFANMRTPKGHPGPDGHNRHVVESMKAWLADPDRHLKEGVGFYLYSQFGDGLPEDWTGYGVGKSYLAGCFANALIALRRKDLSVLWLRAAGIGIMLRNAIGEGEGAELKVRQKLEHAGVLIIDDLDKIQATSYTANILWDTIDSRLYDRRPMVITANQSLDGLSRVFPEQYAMSMASRIAGRCHICELRGPDRRLLQRPGARP